MEMVLNICLSRIQGRVAFLHLKKCLWCHTALFLVSSHSVFYWPSPSVWIYLYIVCLPSHSVFYWPSPVVWIDLYIVCLPSQSAPRKQNQKKEKKPEYLCAPREVFKQRSRPCLIITKACYFDHRPNKAFALFTWSRRTTCANARALFINLITHKSTRSENPTTW